MENTESKTSMLVVWGYVLLSLCIVATGMYISHRVKISEISEKGEKDVAELKRAQTEIIRYREYLQKEGKENARAYFNSPLP